MINGFSKKLKEFVSSSRIFFPSFLKIASFNDITILREVIFKIHFFLYLNLSN